MSFIKPVPEKIKKLLKNKLIIAVVIVLLVGGGWFAWNNYFGKTNSQPTYQTSTVRKGALISSVTASGSIVQGGSVSITTQVSGIVNQVYVKDGDSVVAGQKIADVNLDVSSQQKQAAAWAGYLQAKSALESANNQFNTLQAQLFEANQNFINDAVARDLETDDPTYIQQSATWKAAENDYKNQQTSVQQAQASLSSSWLSYSQLSSTITAPMAGKVSGLTLTNGSAVTSSETESSSFGTVTLDGAKPQANVNLTEIDVIKVKVGQKVTLTLDALSDKTFTGRVTAINTNGSVSSGVTSYPTTITFDTEIDSIYPNMGVNATIITNIADNAILVPSAAVQTNNGISTVRVMKDGQPTQTIVEIGETNDTDTAILTGLKEGDIVVVSQTSSATLNTTTSPFGATRGGFGGAAPAGATQVIRMR